MKYTVAYKPSAEQELARLWTVAANRSAVTAAANRIDVLLGTDPHSKGESRPDSSRIMFEWPLGVRFEVFEEDRYVDVLQVWWVGRQQ